MKNTIHLLILISIFSCKNAIQEKNEVDSNNIKVESTKAIELNSKDLKAINIEGNYSSNFILQLELQPNTTIKNNIVGIVVLDKDKKRLQKINYKPESLMGSNLPKTATTIPKDSIRNVENYDKIIFGDYNFDGLEDFAFINYEGGNAGPQYTYFIQKANKQFEIDEFLSNNMRFFPTKINNTEKTLTIKHPVGCCKIRTKIFQLKNNNWIVISSTEKKL